MVQTITKDLGCVPCGVKVVDTIEIENRTKKTQVLRVNQENKEFEILNSAVQIHPIQVVAQPKQTVRFKLTYISNTEDVTQIFFYNILDGEILIARLKIRAHGVGPSLEPEIFNVKFFRFRDVNQTVKNLEIINTTKHEAKFFFDLDEDYKHVEVSKKLGTVPAGLKLGLKLMFNPQEPGVYYKKIFCIIQFHKPIIFNVIAVNKPKVKLEPKNVIFKYPVELNFPNSFDAYMYKEEIEKMPDGDKISPFQKCLESFELTNITSTEESDNERQCWPQLPEASVKADCKLSSGNIFLTTNYIDICNSSEVLKATSLINLSKSRRYYYEWDHDPKDHFQIAPCKGFIKPNTKTDFTIYFTPSTPDCLYHIETDIRIFLSNEEAEVHSSNTIDLPLIISLKIIGHSFPKDSCGWVPQCKPIPKILHLRPCVPNEIVFGSFMIEREGHLPVNFVIIPTKEQHFTAQPPLGYLSEKFRLIVVRFNNSSKEPGLYVEDLKIKFNNSDLNIETIKILAFVEIPRIIIGKDNSVTFDPIFPGSNISTKIPIENPTFLFLSYEFKIPDDITWLEIINPKGLVEPRGFSEIEMVFKPELPCEYLDYIPCFVSSIHKMDYSETIHLQVIGSCQYGYLVATPSIHDFGESVYLGEKNIQIHLFNFSAVLIYFRLKIIDCNYPQGDEKDVTINPVRGKVAAKGSLTLDVAIKPHKIGLYEYVIECQNFKNESDEAEPCKAPRKVVFLQFEGVLPYIKITDVHLYDGGPLFSGHWLWKMMNIDKINEALKSLKNNQVIKVKIPEAMRNSTPTVIAFMVESSRYGKIYWNINLKLQCPCYEASSTNFLDDCLHTTPVFERPADYVLNASEKFLLLVKINYDFTNECMMVMTFSLPHKRNVMVKMPLVTLPSEGPTCISSYLNPVFTLRSVFIGDPHPPVQLFWLYNNTNHPSSYSVNMEALRENDEHNVFDCLNPEGVIEPFSTYPVAFMFRPTEMMEYSVNVPINLQKEHNPIIMIIGEGVLQSEPVHEIAIPKTTPDVSFLNKEEVECCKDFINIPFIGVFSTIRRIFFVRNTSITNKWAFRWFPFKMENVFIVRVEPESGVINPQETALMTLSMHTFCHPAFISFSIPCAIYNLTELSEYNAAYLLQETAVERSKDYFTITENGITYPEETIPKIEKPKTHHIFITVNANILSYHSADRILNKKSKCILRIEKELKAMSNVDCTLKPPMRQCIQGLLEKLLWDILCNCNVAARIQNCRKSQDFVYSQILPQSEKKKEEFLRLLRASPNKNKSFFQKILENTIRGAVVKNFILEECSLKKQNSF